MKEKDILSNVKQRMGIDVLNDMQRNALDMWKSGGETSSCILPRELARRWRLHCVCCRP